MKNWVILLTAGLIVALLLSILIGINLGYAEIPFSDIVEVVLYKTGFLQQVSVKDAHIDIIYLIRLPRLILAAVVGMSLAVAGVIMQAVVQNPLADPYILGISSGASLGATVGVFLGVGALFGYNSVGICAFFGALGISLLVILLSNVGGKSNTTKLLLSGMALSLVASTFSSLMVYLSRNREMAREISFWLLGSVSGAKWEHIQIIVPIILVCTIFFFTQYRTLDLMLLGDEVAITIGKDLNKIRYIYLIVVSLMIGFVVYVSGIIGFIGLLIPHICRMIVGTSHKRLIFVAGLVGSLLLVWADVLSRIIIPGSELPTGILISVLGAPAFIYLIINKSYRRKT